MINKIGSPELTRLAREGSLQEYAAALKKTGAASLGQAVEVFSQRDREPDAGRLAMERLKDLRDSVMVFIEREKNENNHDWLKVHDEVDRLNSGQHPSIHLESAKTEILSDAIGLTDGKKHLHLKRQTGPETARCPGLDTLLHLQPDPLSGVKNFLVDLTKIQGLCLAALALPGPLGPTLPSLVPTDNSSAGRDCPCQTHLAERIVPGLTELQDRLQQVTVLPATTTEIYAQPTSLEEYEGRVKWFGLGSLVFDRSLSKLNLVPCRSLEKMEIKPPYLRLPQTSISDYTGH